MRGRRDHVLDVLAVKVELPDQASMDNIARDEDGLIRATREGIREFAAALESSDLMIRNLG